MSLDLAWGIADIFMGVMAIINIVSLLFLGKWVFKLLKDFDKQKKKGLNPVFYVDEHKDYPKLECWHVTREEIMAARAKRK